MSRLNQKSTVTYAGDYELGLTVSKSKTTTDIDGPVWRANDTTGECYAPRLSIKIVYDPIEVYVGSEFPKDSCTYNTVLAHEMHHVRLYQENLPRVENIIRELLNKRFGGKPIYTAIGESRELLDKEIDTLWRPLIQSELAKVQIEQNQLDSPESINKILGSCLGDFYKLLGWRAGVH